MSGMAWGKFYWNDWAADPKLRLCTPAAQGLWMRMLCVCAEADGYLTIADRPLSSKDLAAITGWPEHDVIGWMEELERWGVYSIDGKARIYSRRMVSDLKKARTARKNGKNGGNPTLGNKRSFGASDNPPLKAKLKVVDNTQKLEARNQKPEEVSEDKSSGAAAPPDDLNKKAWDSAKALLVGQGALSLTAAGKVFGKILSDYGIEARELLGPIAEAENLRTADPVGYLTRAAQARARRRQTGPPKRVGFV